jgi:hypothetical protein
MVSMGAWQFFHSTLVGKINPVLELYRKYVFDMMGNNAWPDVRAKSYLPQTDIVYIRNIDIYESGFEIQVVS